MNLEFLRAVTAIAEQGSLVAAANSLGLSHSAISLRIKALEADLGITILDRHARPVRLTPLGEELRRHADDMQRLVEEVRAVGRRQQLSGILRLGAVPSTLTEFLPKALASLGKEHPDIELHLRTDLSGSLALALRQGELDVVLTSQSTLPLAEFQTVVVAEEPIVLIASDATEWRPWQEMLEHEPFIWFNRKAWAGQAIERYLLSNRLPVNARMEADSIEAVTALVRHGLGVAILPWRSSLGQDGLHVISLGDPQMTRKLVVMHRPQDSRQRLIKALIDALAPGGGFGLAKPPD